MENNNNIFIKKSNIVDISGKISYTNILETIPENSTESRLENWKELKKTEWRWRFLKLPNNKLTVEISYLNYDSDNRIYFNKYGKWVHREVDEIYDYFVIKEYYYYT